MATLTSTKIKNTYDALLKATDNDAIGSSAKQITDGLGNGTPLYISTTQIGIGVTPEATYDLHVYSNAKVGGNLTVTGDLTVEGTTTTIDTQTLTVEDPLIEVASNNTSTDAVDIGWYGKYAPSGTVLYAGLFRDTGDSKFKLFRNLEEQPTTTVNTSGTGYTVATLVADLEGTLTGVIASTTTATTQTLADNSTKVATTAYVDSSIGNSTLAEVLANGDTTGGGNIVFGDSDVFLTDDTLMFGASNDLVIYHDGSNSFIREKGTGNLYIDGETSISLRKYTGAENMLVANTDGSVELYYDNSKKLETTSTGVTVTGDLTVDTDTLFVDSTNNRVGILTTNPSDALNVDDDVSGSVRITIDNANAAGFSTLRFEENDTERAALYYSNAADTFNLQNNTNSGNLRLQTTNSIGTTTSGIIINGSSEAVELYYAGTKKLETTSSGVTITGTSIHTGIEIESTSPQILFDETDVTANWRNRVSGGSWRVQYASDGSSFSDHFVVGASNATFETGATFAGQVTIPETPVSDTDAASKKYVDDNITAQDLDFAGDSGTGAVDLDSQTFTIAGTTNEIETSASSQTLTIGLPNDVIITGDLTAGYLGDPYLLYADATNARVDIYGNTRMIGGGTRSIQFINDTTNTIAGEIEFDHATEDLSFFTNFDTTNPKMVIDSSGNVGINESDPDTILHISDGNTGDPSTNAPVIRLQNTSENCSNLFTDGDVVGGLEFYNDSIICTDIAYAAGVNAYVRAVHDGSDSPTPTSSLEFGTGSAVDASTRMTIDSSGNVGIGGTSSRKLHIYNTASADVALLESTQVFSTLAFKSSTNSSTVTIGIDGAGNAAFENKLSSGNMTFVTNGSERMRIESDGQVQVKASSGGELLLYSTDGSLVSDQLIGSLGFYKSDGSGEGAGVSSSIQVRSDSPIGSKSYMSFHTDNASGQQNVERMRITSGGQLFLFNQTSGAGNATLKYTTGTGAVTYDTSSRLVKEDIVDIPYGLNTVLSLSPKKYRRIDSDDKIEIGFIADEVQEVVPELVGMMEKKLFTKNEEDTEIIAGSVEYEKMTSILVKAIQEQQDIINDLKAEIETLKQQINN